MVHEWLDNIWLNNADGGGDELDDLNALLDEELLALINADREEEETFQLIKDDFSSDGGEENVFDFGAYQREQDVDTEEEEEEEAQGFVSVNRGKDTKGIGLKALISVLSTAAVLIGVIIVVNFFGGNVDEGEQRMVIHRPELAFHGANNVFMNLEARKNHETITLVRAVFDSAGTAMFFDTLIDIGRTDIRLVCDDGRVHELMPDFYPFVDMTTPLTTTLRFAPFDRLVTGFELWLTDIYTNSVAHFSVGMDGEFHLESAFLAEGMTIYSNEPGVSVSVDRFVASTTHTAVEFSLRSSNPGERLVFGVYEYADSVLSLAAVMGVAPLMEPIMEYFECSGILVGRAYFAPIPNLRGTARVSFRELALRYDVDVRIPLGRLYANRGEHFHIEAGMYDISLYHVISRNNNFRMVGHAINNNVLAIGGQDPLDRVFRREQMHIDAHMEIILPNGEIAVIPGEVWTIQAGSDVVFDARPYAEYMDYVSRDDITIVINSVSFLAGTLSAEICLDSLSHRSPVRTHVREVQEWFVEELGAAEGLNLRVTAMSYMDGRYFAIASYLYTDEEGRLRAGRAKAIFDEEGQGRLIR